MGIAGTLVVAGKSIELRPVEGGAPVEIEIEQVLSQWPLLPAEMRKRKSVEVAQRIAGAHRAARRVGGTPHGPGVDDSWRRVLGAVFALFAVLAIVGALRYLVPRLTSAPPPDPAANNEAARRRVQLENICEGMRTSIYGGRPFDPVSTEGWVIELWLASKQGPLVGHPALAALVAGGKLAPSADAEIGAIRDGTVEVVDGLPGDAATRSPGWHAATVVFREGYTRPFFDEAHRARFVALAERTAAATGADEAALYARCAHRTTHDVGAWFHGPDMAGATAALIYQMGFFAESWRVDPKALVAAGGSPNDLDTLSKLAQDLGDATDRSAVGTQGASVTTAHGATVVFPFSTPVRSVRAARELAQRMGIAVVGGN